MLPAGVHADSGYGCRKYGTIADMKQKIVLVAAVVAGLVAAMLTRFYLSSKDSEIAAMKSRFAERYGVMEVLCYAENVPGGTIISKGQLGTKSVPAAGLRGQALTIENLGDILGRRILLGHRTGDIVFWADIEGGNPRATGLAELCAWNIRRC